MMRKSRAKAFIQLTDGKHEGIIHIPIRDSHVQYCGIAGGRILSGDDVNSTGSRDLMEVENNCCIRSDFVISWLVNHQRSMSR